MKNILLFGMGKSATCLIDYLSRICRVNQWTFTIADASPRKVETDTDAVLRIVQAQVQDAAVRSALIRSADIVISLLPPALHILVAQTCAGESRHLLTASYVDDQIRSLEPAIREKKLLFLCEMGLDPGIDHMSAMQLIHRIQDQGGLISEFRSHTGGLVAPESDDNPWHYKVSWNPRNVVRAGSSGAVYKEHNQVRHLLYQELFEKPGTVTDPHAGSFAFYPNRDSLAYMSLYGLGSAETFIRTTLRHPDFCRGWKDIVAAGLTEDQLPLLSGIKTIADWSVPLKPLVNSFNRPLFESLGLFATDPLPPQAASSADILQYLIERHWKMKPEDHDMIVMLHELGYTLRGKSQLLKSSLVVKGEDHLRTAMAKTVGLPLGIAARLILENKIQLTGLHIPILPEIYTRVLPELEKEGIRFNDTVS